MDVGETSVGLDENHKYIIGRVALGRLLPFIAPRLDLPGHYMRVKIRIKGQIADDIVPILPGDPLNDRFFNEFGTHNTRTAEICETTVG